MKERISFKTFLIQERRRIPKGYLDFEHSSDKTELKKQMKKEISKFSKMDHRDKDAYPDDWPADKRYRDELKRKNKRLKRSKYTAEYEKRFGK